MATPHHQSTLVKRGHWKPDDILPCGVEVAVMLTDIGKLTQKVDNPSAHPSPKRAQSLKGPAGSRPALCNPPAHIAEPDLGPGDKCSCVSEKPPAYKRAGRSLCQETPTTAICSGFWENQTPTEASWRHPTARINLKEVNHT